MRSLLLLALFLLSFVASYAQSGENQAAIDSLLKVLPKAKTDQERTRIYQNLSYHASMSDPDKGLEYATKQLELAKKIKWKEQIAIAYGNMAQNYEGKGDFVKATDNILQALKMFEEINDSGSIATTMIVAAEVYCNIHNFQKAIYYDSMALNIFLKLHKYGNAAVCYSGLAGAYRDARKYTEALQYYAMAYTMADSLHDKDLMAGTTGNIGMVYNETGDCSAALKYLFKALRLNEETGNKLFAAINVSNIGSAYYRLGADSSLTIAPDSLVSSSRAVNLKRAEQYLTRAIAMQREIGNEAAIISDYANLADVQEINGNYKGALENFKLYKKYNDSTQSTDVRLKISMLDTKRETELKEKQIQVNKLAVAQKRNERIIFAAGLGILALISIGIYSRFRNQKKTSEIQEAALKQKEMLMKEIHHRVKNNLQVISSLLNMQVVNINDPQVKEAMTESTSRLKAILLLHQQLYRDDQVANIECSGFISDLFSQVNTVFKKPGQEIRLDNKIDPTILDIDTGMSLGLIVNELTTNSYKYAFGDGQGTIAIEIRRHGVDDYRLYYKDSGPGLPDGLDTKSLKSLGMKIINSLSRQIGGAMHYDKETKTFIITFKDVEGRKKKA